MIDQVVINGLTIEGYELTALEHILTKPQPKLWYRFERENVDGHDSLVIRVRESDDV